MNRICFRVDAGNRVGMGHLMECIALTDAFRKNHDVAIEFLTNDFTPIRDIVSPLGVTIKTLPPFDGEEEELAFLKINIRKNPPDILITNLLNRSSSYYETLREMANHTVVILDDELMREVPGDIVINFSITQDPSFYSSLQQNETRYCIGPSFMPMSQEFAMYRSRYRDIPPDCKNIFVNQGGSDPFGLTAKIIRSLELLQLNQTIHVIMGDAIADAHHDELRAMQDNLKNNYFFSWGIPHEHMLEIMAASDLAITAAGNTLYELAIFGIPSITICHHERHHAVADAFARNGSVVNLGIGTRLEEQKIADTVRNLLDDQQARTTLSQNIRHIVDGRGCERIVNEVRAIW